MRGNLAWTDRRTLQKVAVILLIILIAGIGLATTRFVMKPVATSNVVSLTPSQFEAEDLRLNSLMKTQGMGTVFNEVARNVTSNASFAKDCHPLLHELGHAAYQYYGGFEQAIKYQNEVCDSGYTHGVIEEYLRHTTNLQAALRTACSSAASTFEQWQCYHGLGHGIMEVSMANVQKSIAMCRSFATSFSQNACVNGVFMQHFIVTDHQGNVPKLNPTGLEDCKQQPAEYKTVCYNYAPSAYLIIKNGHYADALNWCRGSETSYGVACVWGVGGEVMKENINNLPIVKSACQQATRKLTSTCMQGAISMYILFYASSSKAEPLCRYQFKAYAIACNQAIAAEHDSLNI